MERLPAGAERVLRTPSSRPGFESMPFGWQGRKLESCCPSTLRWHPEWLWACSLLRGERPGAKVGPQCTSSGARPGLACGSPWSAQEPRPPRRSPTQAEARVWGRCPLQRPPAATGGGGWVRAVLTPARPGSQRAAWPLSPQRPASLRAGGGEPATAGRAPSRSRVIGLINLRVRRPG